MLIPFHFWGAFFGGLTAGIGIGLYSKFVVPKAMVSLQAMISKLDRRITSEGCIYYSPIIIEIMRINEKFFLTHKPSRNKSTNTVRYIQIRLAYIGFGVLGE